MTTQALPLAKWIPASVAAGCPSACALASVKKLVTGSPRGASTALLARTRRWRPR